MLCKNLCAWVSPLVCNGPTAHSLPILPLVLLTPISSVPFSFTQHEAAEKYGIIFLSPEVQFTCITSLCGRVMLASLPQSGENFQGYTQCLPGFGFLWKKGVNRMNIQTVTKRGWGLFKEAYSSEDIFPKPICPLHVETGYYCSIVRKRQSAKRHCCLEWVGIFHGWALLPQTGPGDWSLTQPPTNSL